MMLCNPSSLADKPLLGEHISNYIFIASDKKFTFSNLANVFLVFCAIPNH